MGICFVSTKTTGVPQPRQTASALPGPASRIQGTNWWAVCDVRVPPSTTDPWPRTGPRRTAGHPAARLNRRRKGTEEGNASRSSAWLGEVAVMVARHFDPVRVLGCDPEQALLLFHGRPVTPGEAEAIAEKTYPWRRHLHDSDSYWITVGQAALILHVPAQRVRRLLYQGRLPHIRHASGVRLMRRTEIEALKDRYGDPTGQLPDPPDGGRVPSPRRLRPPDRRPARASAS